MSRAASILTAVLLCAGSAVASAQDPVLAGFERMLGHQPTHLAPATSVARERDLVLEIVVGALGNQWSPRPLPHAKAPATAADDAVSASFARMLNYEPNRVRPAVPAGFGEDPLYAAMVVPLRRGAGPQPVGPVHAAMPQPAVSH